jgi:hypothetical protein
VAIRTSYNLFNQWPDLSAKLCLHTFKAGTDFMYCRLALSLLSFALTAALPLRCQHQIKLIFQHA